MGAALRIDCCTSLPARLSPANDNAHGRISFPLARAARAESGADGAGAPSLQTRPERRTPQGEAQPAQAQVTPFNLLFFSQPCAEQAGGWGLTPYGARHYDPRQGQWISPDPAFDGMNLYGYVHNNPVNMIDPTGYNAVHSRDNPIQVNVEGRLEDGQIFAMGKPEQTGMYAAEQFDAATKELPVYQANPNGLDIETAAAIGGLSSEVQFQEGGFIQSAMEAGLAAGAVLSMQGGDAIRTDGTGSALGNPGGMCGTCTGGRLTQGLFIAATVGALIGGSAYQGYRALQETASSYRIVSSWADKGITPDLNPGRWVMTGLPTKGNFFRSGLPGPKLMNGRYQPSRADINNVIIEVVPASSLQLPPMLWRGILGQRVYRP